MHRGNPDSVYRLTGGILPYNTYLFPPAGTLPDGIGAPNSSYNGSTIKTTIGGENLPETEWQVELTGDEQPGIKHVRTPYGIFPFIVNALSEDVEAFQGTPGQTQCNCPQKR